MKSNIVIRSEEKGKYRKVENLVRESFWNVYRPGYLEKITGEYTTPGGYLVDETAVEEFDRQFPTKEKKKLPGQIFG